MSSRIGPADTTSLRDDNTGSLQHQKHGAEYESRNDGNFPHFGWRVAGAIACLIAIAIAYFAVR